MAKSPIPLIRKAQEKQESEQHNFVGGIIGFISIAVLLIYVLKRIS